MEVISLNNGSHSKILNLMSNFPDRILCKSRVSFASESNKFDDSFAI